MRYRVVLMPLRPNQEAVPQEFTVEADDVDLVAMQPSIDGEEEGTSYPPVADYNFVSDENETSFARVPYDRVWYIVKV